MMERILGPVPSRMIRKTRQVNGYIRQKHTCVKAHMLKHYSLKQEAEVFLSWSSGLGWELIVRKICPRKLQTITSKWEEMGFVRLEFKSQYWCLFHFVFPSAVPAVWGRGSPPVFWSYWKHVGVRAVQEVGPGRLPQTPFFWELGHRWASRQQELGGKPGHQPVTHKF